MRKVLIGALIALAAPAGGQSIDPSVTAAPQISVAEARAIATKIADQIQRQYVFPEKRSEIAVAVRRDLASGRYDVTNPALLAERLTEDMHSASHDEHMWVNFNPQRYRELAVGKSGDPDPSIAALHAREHNHGIEDLKVLEGNIRYMRLTGFPWVAGTTARAIDDAARFLSGGDAVIVDVRNNGGGSAESVQRFVSYFLPATPRTLMTFINTVTNKSRTEKNLINLPSPRLAGKPLMVLIDADTGSAAEGFAYEIQNFKLGTVVGATSAGAANNDTLVPMAPDLVFSISTGRPVNAVTKTNWEGVGVRPDVETTSAAALDEAQLRLLKALEVNSPEERARYAWWEQGIQARLHPFAIDPSHLADYAGVYGKRTITLKDGELVYQRQGSDPNILVPLGPDLFGFADVSEIHVRFRRIEGRVTGFDRVTIDGAVIPSDRTN